jgi:hypothetical protein
MLNNKSVKICVQMPLPEDIHTIKTLENDSSSHARAAFFKSKLWKKNDTIRIKFVDNRTIVEWTDLNILEYADPLETEVRKLTPKEAVKKVVTERLIPIVGLNIFFVEDGDAEIKVGFNPDTGAWSLIGTDCIKSKEPITLNLGWLDVGTIIHEFGHALGMIHEHQSSLENKIQWDEDAVYKWGEKTQGWDKTITYDNIIKKYDINLLNGSKFDECSVMLYFFPDNLTLNNKGTKQNNRLSSYDVEYLSKIYPNENMSSNEFYKKIYGEELFSRKNCKIYDKSDGNMKSITKYSQIFEIYNYIKDTLYGNNGLENQIYGFICISCIIILILIYFKKI